MGESLIKAREYYDADPQGKWNRLDEPPFEFALTIHMMDQYVKPGDSVPDIGGGPGRYSL